MVWYLPWPLVGRKLAACHAVAQWVGETCVGLVPLLAYVMMHNYAKPAYYILACSSWLNSENLKPTDCSPLVETISQELCILTVVISGLSLLSVVGLGPRKRKSPITIFSFFLIVAAIMALLFGALLYALFGAHIDHDADAIAWYILFAALFSSLFLALEGAILDA